LALNREIGRADKQILLLLEAGCVTDEILAVSLLRNLIFTQELGGFTDIDIEGISPARWLERYDSGLE
jgi:hypothetical protein